MKRIEVIIEDKHRLVLASGHEHSLQYSEEEEIKQIVSGSGSKASYVTLGSKGLFGYTGQGFAVYDVFEDGSSWVRFYGSDGSNNPKLLYEKEVYPPIVPYDVSGLTRDFPPTTEAAIYSEEETDRSGFFKTVWGEHYRDVYSTKIKAPNVLLDTLYGGVTIERPGGGHQTRSLRLVAKETGKEYNMRALRKSAIQFIESVILKNNDNADELEESLPEELVQDFYTAAHPYGAFAIPKLSDAVGVLNTTPELYYVPKQPALGKYNDDYGDALYMIVERPAEEYEGKIFSYPDDIESTDDILDKLRSNEENIIDERAYVRARMFDMLLGDWDRHSDQWRWAEFKDQNGKDVFVPIPRDRDQVFSNFDGTLLDVARSLFGAARQFQVYDKELNDVKWFNLAGAKLDRALAQESTREVWIAQAQHIQKALTDEIIEEAFQDMPEEVRNDETVEEIKTKMRGRRDNLVDIAERYYDYLAQLQTVTGTDDDDFFEIERQDNATRVRVWRIIDGEKGELIHERTYLSEETKELWIYGLDDDDVFVARGKGNNPIFTRIIGGQNNDIYRIEDGRRIKVYDHESLPNTIESRGGANFRLTDIYNANTYTYQKEILSSNVLLPAIGFNPDDGVSLGLSNVYTINGFIRNPFTQRHTISAGYFFATEGLNFQYKGEFAAIMNDWNLKITGRYTTPNFAQNFFGFGNETVNPEDELGMDYNRVRISRIEGGAALVKNSDYGSIFEFGALFQSLEVEESENRIVDDLDFVPVEERIPFGTVHASYNYESYDDPLNASRGMIFDVQTGYTVNLDDTDRSFGFINPHLGFVNALSGDRKLTLKTDVRAQFRIGDDFEFYQSASLGQRTGLRGFRFNRFQGETAFSGSGDVRYAFESFSTGLIPLQIGIFGGYDIGRVWLDGEDSKIWHDSYGVGFWVNSADALSGTFNFFNSDEGLRVSFGFGFQF
ncbi:phosphoesterase [Croceiramulus getboli]|nr:phosphoesterase [Flavobacteriaceae bacterium YJPT1-3]